VATRLGSGDCPISVPISLFSLQLREGEEDTYLYVYLTFELNLAGRSTFIGVNLISNVFWLRLFPSSPSPFFSMWGEGELDSLAPCGRPFGGEGSGLFHNAWALNSTTILQHTPKQTSFQGV